jgi:tRNA(fMet)-specific endonuclease VapC
VFALDTNAVIHFFKGAGRVSERLLAVSPGEVAIPSVVLYELEVGIAASAQPSRRRVQLETMLAAITVLPFDEQCARKAAGIASALRRPGNAIGPIDTLIAGTALAHGATLVTNNVREFKRVPGLHVVDWY